MIFKKVLEVQEKIKAEKEKLKDIKYWTSFLKTASMQYKHDFNTQIAIHEAAPNSIACADAQIWRKNHCTFVDSPKAILTEKDGKLHRLFDISQVQGDFTEIYWIWKMDDDELGINYSDTVNRQLCDMYNIYNETLEETIYELSLSKTAQLMNVNGDMYNIVSESAAYMVIHRCCPDSAELSPEKVKTSLANISIDEIGQSVMTVARDLFSEIEGLVKAERTAEIDRRDLDEYNREFSNKGNEMRLQSCQQALLSHSENNSRKNLHTGHGNISLLSDSRQGIESERDNAAGTSELSGTNKRNGESQRSNSFLDNSKAVDEKSDIQIIGNTESPVDKTLRLINEYCEKEFDNKANFSNMDHVDLAYTTDENTELPIEVYADLETFRIVKEYGKTIVSEELFNSLEDMHERLENLEFDDLVSLTDSEKNNLQAEDKIKSDILTKDCYDLENCTFSVDLYDIPLIINDEQRKRFEQFGLIPSDEQKQINFSTDGKNWNRFQFRDRFGNRWKSVDMNEVLSEAELADLKSIISEIVEKNSIEQLSL